MHATAGIPDQVFDALALAVHARHPEAEAKIKLHLHRCKEEIEGLIKLRLLQGLRPTTIGEAMRLNFEISMREKVIGRLLDLLTKLGKSMPNQRVAGPIERVGRPSAVSPIDKLMAKGRISTRDYAAAHFVRWVVEEVAKASGVKAGAFDTAVRPAATQVWHDPLPSSAAARAYSVIYKPWTKRLRKYELAMVIQLVVDETPVYLVARRHRISRSRCISRLRKALDKLGA